MCDRRRVASPDDGREVTAAAATAAAAALEVGGGSCRGAGVTVTHTCVRSHVVSPLIFLAHLRPRPVSV